MGSVGNPETTRNRLLRSAELHFLQKGYTATSVDEICGDAGATKGAFFHHFKSKEQVGLLVLEAHARRRTESMRLGASEPSDDPVGRALQYVDHATQLVLENQQPMCLVASLTIELGEVNERFRSVCEELLGGWRDELTTLFGAALEARGNPQEEMAPEALASQFIASFYGSLLLYRAMRNRSRISEAMYMFRHHLELVLAAPKGLTHPRNLEQISI